MTARLPPEKRAIPEIVTTRRRIGPGPDSRHVDRDNALDVKFFSNSNRQLRYQHLPDLDSSESDDDIERKLKERFEIMREMTWEAIEGRVRGLIVSGPGGVGKTYTIDEALKEYDPTGTQYTSSSGYSTPVGLIKMLYRHRHPDSLLKLDDIDSIFNDEKALNFIKIATDTTQKRVITYESNGSIIDEDTGDYIPNRFDFDGALIFCTNLDFDILIDKGSKLSPHFEALMTRSHYIDLGMRTKRDYLMRVFMVAEQGLFDNVQGGTLNAEEQREVLQFIDKYYKNLRECSLRMALKIGALRSAAREGDVHTWERKALLTCCKGVR